MASGDAAPGEALLEHSASLALITASISSPGFVRVVSLLPPGPAPKMLMSRLPFARAGLYATYRYPSMVPSSVPPLEGAIPPR